ncbi:hypothetical protein RB195_000492 [Necator americanus]|uniref:Uncharacterized protein n=1 Tax=Necator americanus TaxID=51031 RepID=A0ABR1DAV8_NECAM
MGYGVGKQGALAPVQFGCLQCDILLSGPAASKSAPSFRTVLVINQLFALWIHSSGVHEWQSRSQDT